MNRRYRILKYPWHTGHDYELAKLNHDFFFLAGTPRQWNLSQRPIPPSIRWVPDIDSVATDVMILDVDQWTYQEPANRFLFLQLRDSYPGPKIVINHGCNMVDGCSSAQMQDLVGDCHMVAKSATAKKLWGSQNSTFVRHGMTLDEWKQTDYSIHNILHIQPPDHSRFRNLEAVTQAKTQVPITQVRSATFEKYRRLLCSSSIFFNPSHASANPRARTEAMLCGLAVVTTGSHGESEYIDNGVNGYCSDDIDQLIVWLQELYAHPSEVRRIGMAGRETAQRLFSFDSFAQQWNHLLHRVVPLPV